MIKLKNFINESVVDENDVEHEFKNGYKWGKKDYIQGYEDRDLSHFPESFVKGYKKGWKEERRKRWWDSMNAKMTDLLGRMGSSRLR